MCCDSDAGMKKRAWTPEEDKLLVDHVQKNGLDSWRKLPKLAGLNRSGKSCRLRWVNYLHPNIRHCSFTDEEEKLLIRLHSMLGNKYVYDSYLSSHDIRIQDLYPRSD